MTEIIARRQFAPLYIWLAIGVLVLWQHRSNIGRLVHGNENKFSIHRKKN